MVQACQLWHLNLVTTDKAQLGFKSFHWIGTKVLVIDVFTFNQSTLKNQFN